jgi:hypothetical protein
MASNDTIEKEAVGAFVPLLRSIASDAESLSAEERYHRLHILELKYASRFSTSLDQLLIDGDVRISTTDSAHDLSTSIEPMNLAEFGIEYHKFLHTVNVLVAASFETRVIQHVEQELNSLGYASQVNRLAVYEGFPLYRALQSQRALRGEVYQLLNGQDGFDGELLKSAERQCNDSSRRIELFEDVFMVQEFAVHIAASRTDLVRQHILTCITHEEPRDLATRISRLEDPDSISIYKSLWNEYIARLR